MKEEIKEMGLGNFLSGLMLLCFLIFCVFDCSVGSTRIQKGDIVDRERIANYDKDGHYKSTDYYLYINVPDGIHRVEVSAYQYHTVRMGETRILRSRRGKLLKINYLEFIE